MARVTSEWCSPPDVLDLQPHQVDVWRIRLDLSPVTVKRLESTLSTEEAQRAARFHFEKGRIRYTVAHSSLRDILSRYLNCETGELSFGTNEYGKPSVRGHKLEFNLSHSGDVALIGVSKAHKVGVDVERIRSDIEFESLAKRFFSANEVDELMSVPPDQRAVAFFTCWARKEAYIKAQGLGLSLPLDSFDVSLSPNEPALIRATRPNPEEAALWTLVSLDIASDYAGTVAVEGQKVECRLWDWSITIL